MNSNFIDGVVSRVSETITEQDFKDTKTSMIRVSEMYNDHGANAVVKQNMIVHSSEEDRY